MTEYKRVICPECGNKDNRKIHDEPDRSKILYYSMQGNPVIRRIKNVEIVAILLNK